MAQKPTSRARRRAMQNTPAGSQAAHGDAAPRASEHDVIASSELFSAREDAAGGVLGTIDRQGVDHRILLDDHNRARARARRPVDRHAGLAEARERDARGLHTRLGVE